MPKFEHINEKDFLDDGRRKINKALDDSKEGYNKSIEALGKANQSIHQSQSTQDQLNQLIIEGDSSVEAAAARVDEKNVTHSTLKDRIDEGFIGVKTQLADTDKQRHTESIIQRKTLKRTTDGKDENLFISFVIDDGRKEDYDVFKPIMESKGIPVTFALITNRAKYSTSGTYINAQERQELSDLGAEFISHSHYHGEKDENGNTHPPLTSATYEEIEYEFQETVKQLKEWGYNHRAISLPFASNNYDIQALLRKYFDYAIGTSSDLEKGKPFYPAYYSNYYIRRVRIENGIEFAKQRIDEAKASGKAWVVLGGHGYEPSVTTELMEELVDYANNLGFKWVNTQEGMEAMGNIAQFGESMPRTIEHNDAGTRIGADGTIESNIIGKVRRLGDFGEFNFHTPITDFPEDTITITKTRIPDEGFPTPSGTLYTYRIDDDDIYGYQQYVSTRKKNIYIRYWDENTEDWTPFERINITRYSEPNRFTSESEPSDETQYQITYTQITSENSNGFPENASGTLIFNHYTSYSYVYQEYQLYLSAKKYKRYWNNGSKTWSPWRKVDDIVAAQRRNINTFDATTPPEEFEIGITSVYITLGGNSTGLPENKRTGNLITYKDDGNGSIFQDFREGYSSSRYYRFLTNNGTWSNWHKIMVEVV